MDNANYDLFLQASCIYVDWIEVFVEMAINFNAEGVWQVFDEMTLWVFFE